MKSIFLAALVAMSSLVPNCCSQEFNFDLPESFTNTLNMEFRLLPKGEFEMGSAVPLKDLPVLFGLPNAMAADFEEAFSSERPSHTVEFSSPFYVGTTEVTRKQFKSFIDDTGYKTDAEKEANGGRGFEINRGASREGREFNWMNPGFKQADDHPVTNVSWNDANAFCKWLSGKEGREYQLPTEAQWEYACRAGTKTLFYSGNKPSDIVKVGNVLDAKALAAPGMGKMKPAVRLNIDTEDGFVATAPVKSFKENDFLLYDMHGNVSEWCRDWHGPYENKKTTDPEGPEQGKTRVQRGGNWVNFPLACRSAARATYAPNFRFPYVGFRVFLKSP